jgi:uncharacterized Zn-binding protein involved in type VI secretion
MAGKAAARLGDSIGHGSVPTGSITQVTTQITTIEGIKAARVSDKIFCALPSHGNGTIVSGSAKVKVEGKALAFDGSICSCGAVVIATAVKTLVSG